MCAALEIYKQVSGPDHPDVAITYHNLGLLYSSHNNRLVESEEMYMKGKRKQHAGEGFWCRTKSTSPKAVFSPPPFLPQPV